MDRGTGVLADGTDAPAGVDGELRIRGERVFKGYLDPVLNETAFDAGGDTRRITPR